MTKLVAALYILGAALTIRGVTAAYVGGEEVDAVAVKIPASAVVVLTC